jgi:glycosyltransferase involved in cell wall biosynthesis
MAEKKTFPKTVSFIVLALNEEKHIEQTVYTINDALAQSVIENYEIILVDDGSTDGTFQKMQNLKNIYPKISVINNQMNLGFGGAYLKGAAYSTMEYLMIIAGDNIMPAKSITRIIDSIGECDLVLPYMTDARFREPLRRIGSWVFARLINIISGTKIRYYNSMVVRSNLLKNLKVDARGYTLQAECVVRLIKGGANYSEIGVDHGHKSSQCTGSKALHPKNILNVLNSIIRLLPVCRH